jgi:hypothetical protein
MSVDCHTQLVAALSALFVPTVAQLLSEEETKWASITFSGARHRLHFQTVGAEAKGLIASIAARLAEVEFTLRGHIVADIAVISQSVRELVLEALTVEAA